MPISTALFRERGTAATPTIGSARTAAAGLCKGLCAGRVVFPALQEAGGAGALVNLPSLGLSLSTYGNGVAKLHGEPSRKMFPQVPIEAITNGVHAATWASPAFQELFDRCIPSWREDNYSLRSALGLPPEAGWSSHLIAKHALFETVRKQPGVPLDPEVLTISCAR